MRKDIIYCGIGGFLLGVYTFMMGGGYSGGYIEVGLITLGVCCVITGFRYSINQTKRR